MLMFNHLIISGVVNFSKIDTTFEDKLTQIIVEKILTQFISWSLNSSWNNGCIGNKTVYIWLLEKPETSRLSWIFFLSLKITLKHFSY